MAELRPDEFNGCDIEFTDSLDVLKKASFHIVAVPTPVDQANQPDLNPVLKASESIGKVLKKGDYVVYESTVIPVVQRMIVFLYWKDFQDLRLEKTLKWAIPPNALIPETRYIPLPKY